MKKKNNIIKWILGILVILVAVAYWTTQQMQDKDQGILSASSHISSQNNFLKFLKNFFGIQGQNNSSSASNESNSVNQNYPGLTSAGHPQGKTTNNMSPGTRPNEPLLNGQAAQTTEAYTVPTTNSENNPEMNSEINTDNTIENNSAINTENNSGINAENNSENTQESNGENNSGNNSAENPTNNSTESSTENSADNSAVSSTDNSGSNSGNNSGDNSGSSGLCTLGCYPGCNPGCDSECTPACLAGFSSGDSSGNNSGNNLGNGSGNSGQPNYPVINPIPSDAQVAQSIAEQNQRAGMLATLLARQNALAAKVNQSAEATKYQTVDSGSIPPADTTPAPQDVVDKIKSAQLIQH